VLSALPQGKHTGEVGTRAGEGSVKVKSVKLDRWRMPLYEYRCRDCGKEFEALILPSFSNVPACPACGSTNLEQLLSAFSVNSEERSKASLKIARRQNEKVLRDQRIATHEQIEKDHD
jgi:putative FmdB family regulatory protein